MVEPFSETAMTTGVFPGRAMRSDEMGRTAREKGIQVSRRQRAGQELRPASTKVTTSEHWRISSRDLRRAFDLTSDKRLKPAPGKLENLSHQGEARYLSNVEIDKGDLGAKELKNGQGLLE